MSRPGEPAPAIGLESVQIRYGSTVAIDEVSLAVRHGELHVLLGESSSGKTTLLRAIAGFEAISAGSLSLSGELVDAPQARPRPWVPPERRHLGFVFQDYSLFPHLSVVQNVAFGMPRAQRQRAVDYLDRVGLAAEGHRRPAELSGGQQQRVALARALAQAPSMVLLDEPLSNLNSEMRRRLRHETGRLLREERMTAVLVTHDAEEAFFLADRLSVIHRGRLLQTGTPREIYETPQSVAAALSVGDALFLDAEPLDAGRAAHCALGLVPVRRSVPGGKLMLRPEQLRILAQPADSAPGAAATVRHCAYLGSTVELEVALEAGDRLLRVRLPAHEAPESRRVHVLVDGPATMV
jgi:iron(III) transport system ATP-binding protein